jgi:hypothetical protein
MILLNLLTGLAVEDHVCCCVVCENASAGPEDLVLFRTHAREPSLAALPVSFACQQALSVVALMHGLPLDHPRRWRATQRQRRLPLSPAMLRHNQRLERPHGFHRDCLSGRQPPRGPDRSTRNVRGQVRCLSPLGLASPPAVGPQDTWIYGRLAVLPMQNRIIPPHDKLRATGARETAATGTWDLIVT